MRDNDAYGVVSVLEVARAGLAAWPHWDAPVLRPHATSSIARKPGAASCRTRRYLGTWHEPRRTRRVLPMDTMRWQAAGRRCQPQDAPYATGRPRLRLRTPRRSLGAAFMLLRGCQTVLRR